MLREIGPLLAQEDASGGLMQLLIMFGVIFGIMYFVWIRPQRKQEERRRNMVQALGKGDEVMTVGGIYGKVVKVKDDKVVLKVDAAKGGAQITFSQQAILGKAGAEDGADSEEPSSSRKKVKS